MKKFISLAVAVAMAFTMSVAIVANPGQNPNQNPGTANKAIEGVTVSLTGGGNNMVISVRDNATGATTTVARAGNGTFNQSFEAFGHAISIQVQGNSLRAITATRLYVCEDICEDCGVCTNCYECECVEPIVVDLGFIGHYMFGERVLSTTAFWLTLNEGEMLDWDAVAAGYAAWEARGGLAIDSTGGWKSSGFAPLFFADGDAIGHGDFSFAQLEGYYRAFFVATGYTLPYVCVNVCVDCGICTDCGECECVEDVFNTASWSGRVNVQGGNNGRIIVTVNGTAYTLTVNAQQAGTRTHVVDGFVITVTANSNNFVTAVTATSTVANIDVVINGVVSLTNGNQQ
jgi:ferredoxin